MSTDNFDFDLTTDFDGYFSSIDKTKAGPKLLVRGSKNVYRKNSGTIASRFGQKRRGQADATLAGVKSSFEWNTSKAAILPLRVCNSKLQVESNIADGSTLVWYDLLSALTLTRFVFDTWWDDSDKKDLLLFGQGNQNLGHWDGGITLIQSGTMTTITKQNTATTFAQDGFASTGKITINGVDYAYTGGTNTTTLTGVGTDASGLTPGLLGLSTVAFNDTSGNGITTNDFIKVINNRVHIGSYTSRLVAISSDTNYTDYSVPAARAPGDPELLTLDDSGKGITVRNGNAHIFAGTGNLYIVTYQQITVGAVLIEQTTVSKIQLGNLLAALAHEFIDILNNNIVYLDQNNQLRAYGTFRNLFQDASPSLSEAVSDELSEVDFTGGQLRVVSGNTSNIIYLTSPLTGSSYFYQEIQRVDPVGNVVAQRLWHPPQIWNLARIALISGVVYGHSNANPQIYQLWDTNQWHDDSPSGDPLPYTAVQRMSYKRINSKQGERRQGLAIFDKAFFEGFISPGVNLYANVYFGYQGAQGLEQVIINSVESPAELLSGTLPTPIGNDSLGDNPLGDGLTAESNDQELLPKFVAITDINPINCFEYELEVYSTDPDSRWEILSLGVNATLAQQQVSFIRK